MDSFLKNLKLSYMSQVKVHNVIMESNFTQPDAFSSKPIPMLDFMDISIHAPVMEKCVQNFVSTEYTKSRPNYARIEIMRERKMRIDSFFDPPKIVFTPDFL